jgi:cellulose synthase/poly-beta-1,6-N-acetylglucosamine synthase-like glycosyltransferase
MTELFWVSAALVLYTYFGYPLLVCLVSLFRNRPVRAGDHQPRVSFIIAAYNEASVIEPKLRNTLALEYPSDRLEVIVASDGSTDATNEIVRRFQPRGVKLIAGHPRRGKNGLLNHVIPLMQGEVIVISDANIELAPDAMEKLMRPLADPEVGGVWGNKIYRNPSSSAAGEGEALYLRYEKLLKSRESRIGSIVAGECSCLAFRREMFRELPLDIPDDFALSTNVVWNGKRMLYASDARSYEDTSPTDRDELRRKIRIIERGVRGFFRVLPLANPFRTGFYSVSLITRQLLRRMVALFIVLMAVALPFLASRGGTYRVMLWTAVLILLLAAAGSLARGRVRRVPFLYIPYYLVMVNIAALLGIGRCLFGYRSITWQPTSRARQG